MKIVSATEAKQTLGAVLDAAQREPVIVRRQNRDVAAIVSMEDFDRIQRSKTNDFIRLYEELAAKAKARGMTEEIARELLENLT